MRGKSAVILFAWMLFFVPGLGQSETIKIRIINETADIYLKPDLKSLILRTVKAGVVLNAETREGEWYRVSFPPDERGFTITGYVHSSLVETEQETDVIEAEGLEPPPVETSPEPDLDSVLPEVGARRGPRLGFRFVGGLGFPSVGDPNRLLEDLVDYSSYPSGTSFEGEIGTIQKALDFDADILIYITKYFGLALGSGYISAKNPADKSKLRASFETHYDLIKNEMKMRAVPIRLGVFYAVPVASFFRVSLLAGAGYYFAGCSNYAYHEMGDPNVNVMQEWDTRGSGFGFQGRMGFEFDVTRNFGFVMEACGRYAKLDGFSGTYKRESESVMFLTIPGFNETPEGDLYYFETILFSSDWYPILMIRNSEPGNPSVPIKNLRSAVIDFSGVSFRFGLKLSF